jgi:hypothetical protein
MAAAENDLLKLPAGFDSPDPIDGNPFPVGDIRHKFWKRATEEAEMETAQLRARFLRSRPKRPLRATLDADVAYFTTLYDIWCKRGGRVILTDVMLSDWDQWLANYANAVLNTFNSFYPPASGINNLRDKLLERREHWKAEGRRCVAFQREHQSRISKSGSPPAEKSPAVVSKPTVAPQTAFCDEADIEPVSSGPATERRRDIDRFIKEVNRFIAEREEAGTEAGQEARKINRTDIWTVAGYTNATEFERFQRADPRSGRRSIQKFKRTLSMSPEKFLEARKNQQKK